jgi:hypothetical protein
MAKKITDIAYWDIFLICFPSLIQIYDSKNSDNISDGHWLTIAKYWREVLLYDSDWTQIPDNNLTEEQRNSWRLYRQELRDMTDTYPDPTDIVFPDTPS